MKRLLRGTPYVLVSLLFASNLLLSGCGSSVEASKASADSLSLSAQNQKLQTENSQLNKTVSQLEQDKRALNAKVADLTSKLGQSSQQWQDLQDLQARVNQLDSQLTVQKQINRDLSGTSADVERASMGSGLKPPTTQAQFKRNYDEGLRLFRGREYGKALAIFGSLTRSSAMPSMTGNAYYWTGECYYALQKYSDAINSFKTVLTFPKSFKIGAAYLMLGMSYVHLGDKAQARATWEELLRNDPRSQYAAKARQYISQL